jgi:hypothetical protein
LDWVNYIYFKELFIANETHCDQRQKDRQEKVSQCS